MVELRLVAAEAVPAAAAVVAVDDVLEAAFVAAVVDVDDETGVLDGPTFLRISLKIFVKLPSMIIGSAWPSVKTMQLPNSQKQAFNS